MKRGKSGRLVLRKCNDTHDYRVSKAGGSMLKSDRSPAAQAELRRRGTEVPSGGVTGERVYRYLRQNYPERALRWVVGQDWHFHPRFPLDRIHTDRRPGGRDPKKVAAIEEAIRAGRRMEPVVLCEDADGAWVADGYHRLLALRHLGRTTVTAYVADGGPRKAARRMHASKRNKSLVLRKANATEKPDCARWITIGGHEEGAEKHKDGVRVLIDADGRILGGNVPASAHGKSIDTWWRNRESEISGGTKDENAHNNKSEQNPRRFIGEARRKTDASQPFNESVASRAAKHQMSPEEYRRAVAEHAEHVMERAQPWVRVHPSTVKKLIGTRRFLSQFEAGESSGYFNPEMRAAAERYLLGYVPDTDPAERPIYGYFSEDPDGTVADGAGSLQHYGQVGVRLKRDSLAHRTTYMWDDSLQYREGARGAPAHLGETTSHGALLGGSVDPLGIQSVDDVFPYVEAQYHGGLRLDDIAEIVVPPWYDVSKVTAKMLQDAGIPWRYAKDTIAKGAAPVAHSGASRAGRGFGRRGQGDGARAGFARRPLVFPGAPAPVDPGAGVLGAVHARARGYRESRTSSEGAGAAARGDLGRRAEVLCKLRGENAEAPKIRKALLLSPDGRLLKGYLTDTYGDDPHFHGFGETTRPHQRSREAEDEVAVNENVFAKGGRPHHHGGDRRVYRCRHGDGGRMVLQDGDRYPTWVSESTKAAHTRLLLRAMETPYWEKAYRDGPDMLAPTPNTAHVAAHGVNTEGATVRIDKNGRIYVRGRNAEAVKSRLRARLDTMQTSEAWVGGHMTLGQDKGFQRYPEARKSMSAEEKARPSYRRRLAREKRIRAWKKREPLTAAERAEARARFGRTLASGVGWAKFAGGYVCYTHRARSNVYPSIAKMPASVVKFIKSPRGRLIPPALAVGMAARSLPSIARTLCLW